MKKNSKVVRKDYSLLEHCVDRREYYGLFIKNGKVKIDTKRYKKFFKLPDEKIEHRKTVYYTPSRICREDYSCNIFRDALQELKELWYKEFSNAVKNINTPKDVENNVRNSYLMDGICDYEEASVMGVIASVKRENSYRFVIKSIYAQFYQQMMATIDALSLKVIASHGYNSKDFSRRSFDVYIQGKQNGQAVSFLDYDNYAIYDRAYMVWNFIKHNSIKSYDELKEKYPEMINDPKNLYKNGDIAIYFLNLDESFILDCLDNMHKFFDEVCERGFGENIEDARWDYAQYFIDEVDLEIDGIVNPLGLPPWV